MNRYFRFFGLALLPAITFAETTPLASGDLMLLEQAGLVTGEAEHFIAQTLTTPRAWHLVAPSRVPTISPDGDSPHLVGASGGAYLEALPDARRTHYEPIVVGESFSNTGGAMAVLSYRVRFTTPGRYYVWVRAFSTGGEDNGIHIGLNGTWPASGLRWQTTFKRKWAWDSRQRTDAVPRGERYKLYLDIPSPGDHTIQFSLREDGSEFDRWLLTTDRDFVPNEVGGPLSPAAAGILPPPFALPAGYADPIDPVAPHDGTGLAMVEGDFRPEGRVTLVLNPATTHPMPADAHMEVVFTHESRTAVLTAACHAAPDGKWRATFSPDRPGQWYFTVHVRHPDSSLVTLYHNLSGIFPVTLR